MLRFEDSCLAISTDEGWTSKEVESYKEAYEDYYARLEADLYDIFKKYHKKYDLAFNTRTQFNDYIEMVVDFALSKETEKEVFNHP